MVEEVCFPRGRPSKNSQSSKPKLSTYEKPQRLFREDSSGKTKDESIKAKTKKSKVSRLPGEAEDLIEDGSIKVKSVEYLTYNKIQEGMLLLGCVKSIGDLELVVSLPSSLTAYIKATHISSSYTKMLQRQVEDDDYVAPDLSELFHEGQLVVGSVIQVDALKHSIHLSIDPRIVNRNIVSSSLKAGVVVNGSVTSEEDHGYMIDIGKNTSKAFIPTKHADADSKLQPGSSVRCVVMGSKADGAIITLSNDKRKLDKAVAKVDHRITLDNLQPGTLVKFSHTKTIEGQGEIGRFLTFEASIALTDSFATSVAAKANEKEVKGDGDEVVEEKSMTAKIEKKELDGSTVACVLYVTIAKHVALTTRATVWREQQRLSLFQSLKEKYPVGGKCKVVITQAIKGIGVMCKVDKHTDGFVLMKNVQDKRDGEFDCNVGKQLKARILSNLSLGGALELSCRKSVLDSTFLTFEDVTPAAIVQAKILAVEAHGLQVLLGSGQGRDFRASKSIRGFVPAIHLSDIILKRPEKRFNEGDVLKCRVLTVDAKRHHLHLTHKPTLVNLKQPIVTGYAQLAPGDIVTTFIAAIQESGCIVKMFNNVSALVPRVELANQHVESPDKTFFVGQVMKCRVLTVDAENSRLRMSFCLQPRTRTPNQASGTSRTVSVRVVSKSENEMKVTVIASSQHPAQGTTASLHKHHISDFIAVAEARFTAVHPGQLLDDCALYCAQPPKVTMKRSVLEWVRTSPEFSFSDLQPDLLLPGFVRHHVHYGVFVEFVNGLVGLCPKSAMTDHYLAESSGFFHPQQSVLARVTEVDNEKRRFTVSLRPSECKVDIIERLHWYASEIFHRIHTGGDDGECKLEMGQVVTVSDVSWENGGRCAVQHPDIASFQPFLLETSEAGDVKRAVVVDVDKVERKVLLSCDTQVLNAHVDPTPLAQEATGSKLRCRVLTTSGTAARCVVTGGERRGRLMLVTAQSHCNDDVKSCHKFASGQLVDVSPLAAHTGSGVLLCSLAAKPGIGQRLRKDSELTSGKDSRNIPLGTEVGGVIKSIRPLCALVHIDSLPAPRDGSALVGRVHASEVRAEVDDQSSPLRTLRVGQRVKAWSIGRRTVRKHTFLEITHRRATRSVPELSLFRSDRDVAVSDRDLLVGSAVIAYVKSFNAETCNVIAEIFPGVEALVPRLLVSAFADVVTRPKTKLPLGIALQCNVIKRGDNGRVQLCRKGAICDSAGDSATALTSGCRVNGQVRAVVSDGLLVRLPLGCKGKLHITHLRDSYIDLPLNDYAEGQIVRCAVVDCSRRDAMVLTTRPSLLRNAGDGVDVIDDIIVGDDVAQLKPRQVLRGFVKSFAPAVGVFVSLSPSISGRVTFNHMSKFFIRDTEEVKLLFQPGKLVTCCVLSVSPQDGRVELSLLADDTGLADLIPPSFKLPKRKRQTSEARDSAAAAEEQPRVKKRRTKSTSRNVVVNKIQQIQPDDVVKVVHADDVCGDDVNMTEEPGFVWDDDVSTAAKIDDVSTHATAGSDSGIDDDVITVKEKKKVMKQKEQEKTQKEEAVKKREEAVAEEWEEGAAPNSVEEWERLLISEPHNSMLWIRYMSFHLHSTQIEHARAVAERALNTIDFRQEEDRLNVWVARLNMENIYGTSSTLHDTLTLALQHNDQLKVYNHVLAMYSKSDQPEKAEEAHVQLTKKFRSNRQVWLSYMDFLLTSSRPHDAHELLKRSLLSTDKKAHVEVISKFARMCFEHGETERGRTLFDETLTNFPKRTDVWSLYVDALIKAGLHDDARTCFERVTSLSISSKKARAFLTRFVSFEQKHGTDASLGAAKRKALEFAERLASSRVIADD